MTRFVMTTQSSKQGSGPELNAGPFAFETVFGWRSWNDLSLLFIGPAIEAEIVEWKSMNH